MSYYQMAYNSLMPNGYRGLKYSPQYPRTPCPADAAAVARMQRMHATCRNTGRMVVGPSGCTNQWHNLMIEVLSLCRYWPHVVSNKLIIALVPAFFHNNFHLVESWQIALNTILIILMYLRSFHYE